MDWIGWIALIEYLILAIISALTTYVFIISNSYRPNFMIKATIYLLASLTLVAIAIFLMRFATALDITFIHELKDPLLMIPRAFLLFALCNFLSKSVKKF